VKYEEKDEEEDEEEEEEELTARRPYKSFGVKGLIMRAVTCERSRCAPE
jgi:hypothetical protein